ncbi:hypothetical protein AB0F15_39510 [Amycolatopsis sp. NPDC026612]|uniref:hypothetical protein n=1 Tax=Amycolatopsis sp. NPDC026612 TaxID=3155466 RepID=UPI0033F3470F
MTALTLFEEPERSEADFGDVLGIIGERQLIAVQLFDIARHTSHPVAIKPSSFVAVTGRGPRDSNESGKTSFNAAVSLLLGDPEWRATGGGVATVAQLLFEPDTAGVTATSYPAAQTGYVVGVFAHPDDVAGSAYTVWLRIASSPKYIRVRHQAGVHLVEADTDAERHRRASGVWSSLPPTEFGANMYVEGLYGRSPRCLAYVASRGSQRSGPSLLKMDTGAFRPEDIGAALIRLTGRSEALELEKEQRRKLAEQNAEVEAAKVANDEKWLAEEKILDDLRTRETVRAKLREGDLLWRKHLARGLLDTVARADWLTAQIRGTETELSRERARLAELKAKERELRDFGGLRQKAADLELAFRQDDVRYQEAQRNEGRLAGKLASNRSRIAELEESGARDVRLTVAEAEAEVEIRREARAAAMAVAAQATGRVEELSAELERAELGTGGSAARTLGILVEHGVKAIGLMDAIEVAEGHRDVWEPRLHPWRAAVCVAEGEQAHRAAEVLADVPGAVVIAGSPRAERSLPTGLKTAPNQALAFLAELETRTQPVEFGAVKAVLDAALGVTVVAGFPRPTTGRVHIISTLREQLAGAEELREQTRGAARIAKQREEAAGKTLVAAHAAAERAELISAVQAIERTELPAARLRSEESLAIRETSLAAHTGAQADLRNAESTLARAEAARGQCEKSITDYQLETARLRQKLEALDVSYWQLEFGGDPEAARVLLNWADGALEYDDATAACVVREPRNSAERVERRTQDTLSQSANDYLVEIFNELKVDRASGEGAPTPAVADALRRKEALAGRSPSGRDTGYAGIAAALRDWITQFVERDQLAVERITSARRQRERETTYAVSTLAALAESLDNVQGSLERRIEANLDAISKALDDLNRSAPDGYGAKLQHAVERPVGPDDPWTWSVVPMWRRSPAGRMLPYNNATNSAQEKLFSIHLVLAALLASPNPRGRVLILDELGDSLGEEHRRDVLSAVARVAEKYDITVFGTCQDAVMPDAAAFCREILYFCYPSKSEALNLPTRMFGFDDNGERVELTSTVLVAGRPLP